MATASVIADDVAEIEKENNNIEETEEVVESTPLVSVDASKYISNTAMGFEVSEGNRNFELSEYEFNVVGSELYSFIWDDFCDWYIELAKITMNDTTKTVLLEVLTNILKKK